MTVGIILKQIRKSKKISQKEIAQVLNVSPSSIYRFERGGDISLAKYLEYCKYLGIIAYVPLIIYDDNKLEHLSRQIYQGKVKKVD